MINPKRYLVTAALPYANGPVHIGHLAGCYLPADIYVRYLRSQKRDVQFVGGSDEHGVPITIRALKEGITPQQVVDRYHAQIKESMEQMGISFNIYSRTSNPVHHKTASDFFKKMYDDGLFEEKETEQYYDESTNTFLADRYIVGTCPVCANPNAYGDQCEKCGSTLSPEQLINPRSTLSDAVPIKKKTTHWYFPLQDYEPWLKEWLIEGHKEWKNNVYGQCKSWLDNGLHSRAMTRDSNWGIKVPKLAPPPPKGGILETANSEETPESSNAKNPPLEGREAGKVLYVWFDAPIGYISATKELTENWADYWCKDDTKLVHFIGKDNIVFHCIIFPAMLKAHGGFVLPENVPANEFLNIEGEKVSTSRNWAVWVHEYIKDFAGCEDVLRYVLCANAPETKDNDFTWKDFQDRNNSELVSIFGNFVNRTWVLMHKLCGGKVPKLHEDILDEKDKALIEDIAKTKVKVESLLEEFKFRDALFEVIDLSRKGNKYMQEKEPWIVAKKLASPNPSEGGASDSENTESLLGYQTADPFVYGLLKTFVSEHRSNPTETENILWQILRGKKLDSYKFRRQHIIGSYIADFVCLSQKLIVEVDGLNHQIPENLLSDGERTAELKKFGFEVIRFTNEEVINNTDSVLNSILSKLSEKNSKESEIKNPPLEGREAAQKSIDNCLHLCLQLTANLAILINPFLPTTAQKMLGMMKVVDKMLDWNNAGKVKLLSVGYSLREPQLLFRKIEDAEITAQVEKLKAGASLNPSKGGTLEPAKLEDAKKLSQTLEPTVPASINPEKVKEAIQFDDFAKIDLKVGTILSAEKVEKADKLLKLQIDLGFEVRTVVSGIALHFQPEAIVGKQVVVVANLAPRKMRGIESNGMILMAEDADGKLKFVSPAEVVNNGSGVT